MKKFVLKRHAPKRLRAIADAIEAGGSLTEVADKFRLDATSLQRVLTPKKRKPRPVINEKLIKLAAERIQSGETFAQAADALGTDTIALTVAMHKRGLTATTLRPSRALDLNLAAKLYEEGMSIVEIAYRTGFGAATVYNHFREHGIRLRGRGR